MDDKQRKIAITLFVLTILFTIIGSTLAYWNWASAENEKTNVVLTVTSGFSCGADGGGSITSQQKILAPTSCTNETYAFQREVTTNVTNNRNGSVYMDLWLDVNTIGTGLTNSSNFRYALTEQANDCEHNILSEGTFNGVEDGGRVNLLEGTQYASSDSNTYYLYVWLDSAETDSATQNQPFNISLGGQCTDETPKPQLINVIKSTAVMDNVRSTFVNNDSGIQFNAISSDDNGKGIYERAGTENDANPIYYYRGAVTDNNVLFANFCWKIVRTTSTGGIKLIYNGSPSNGQCTNSTAESTQIGTSAFNSTDDKSLANAGYMYGTRYPITQVNGTGWYYAPDVIYENGAYTLAAKSGRNVAIKNSPLNGTTLNYYHYTCGSSTATTCTNVYYVFYAGKSSVNYITLSNGKKVENALSEMLSNSTNSTDSTIKIAIDTWYHDNMTSYTSKLEDTPWCNDRSIYQLNGFDPDGGSATTSLYFSAYERIFTTYSPSLSCNKNDAFTVNETITGNGNLINPVGMLTADEIMLAGGMPITNNKNFYLYINDQSLFSLSPRGSASISMGGTDILSLSSSNANIVGESVSVYNKGVRPCVSLKPGTKVVSGDGKSDTPYVVG